MEMSDIGNAIKHNPALCLYYVLKTKTYLPLKCNKLMPVLQTYLLDEIKEIQDPQKYHEMDIKLNKLGREATDEFNELYSKSLEIDNSEEKNLAYSQSLLAQCVSAAFSIVWYIFAMLSGKDYAEMILSSSAQFIATAAGSDGFKNPEDLTDFETRWHNVSKDFICIPEFPCDRLRITKILSDLSVNDIDKKKVLTSIIE